MKRVERTFDPVVGAIAQARAFVRATVDHWEASADEAVLVVSELATNVLRHANGPFDVCLERTDTVILIEVSDVSRNPAHLGHPRPDDTGGRGLMIVDQISRAWGSRVDPRGGKKMWAELPLRAQEARRGRTPS